MKVAITATIPTWLATLITTDDCDRRFYCGTEHSVVCTSISVGHAARSLSYHRFITAMTPLRPPWYVPSPAVVQPHAQLASRKASSTAAVIHDSRRPFNTHTLCSWPALHRHTKPRHRNAKLHWHDTAMCSCKREKHQHSAKKTNPPHHHHHHTQTQTHTQHTHTTTGTQLENLCLPRDFAALPLADPHPSDHATPPHQHTYDRYKNWHGNAQRDNNTRDAPAVPRPSDARRVSSFHLSTTLLCRLGLPTTPQPPQSCSCPLHSTYMTNLKQT